MDQRSVPPSGSSDNVHQFPGSSSKKVAAGPIDIKTLPITPDERLVLTAYFRRKKEQEALEVCDELGIGEENEFGPFSRICAAVGQILVQDVQDRLPQWSATYNDGRIVFGREIRKNPDRRTLAFIAQKLFMINWGDSGPGFSWPEAYNLLYVPGFERYAVIASQDSPDCWGWTDQAIGHFPAALAALEGSRRVIRRYWRREKERGAEAWAHLFSEGLISKETAKSWKRRIWPARSDWE